MKRLFFDLGFGVVLPVFCLWIDPIVFKHSGMGVPMLGFLRPEAYLTTGLCIGTLLWWKFLPRDPWGVLTGWLALGGTVSMLVGVVILPVSLVGLFLGVGVMGVLPWLCALVFFRNAREAWRDARAKEKPETCTASRVFMSAVTALALIGWGGHEARTAKRFISAHAGAADQAEQKSAIDRLKIWRSLIGEDFLVEDYIRSPHGDPGNVYRVQVYEYVTRRDFETSLSEVFKE